VKEATAKRILLQTLEKRLKKINESFENEKEETEEKEEPFDINQLRLSKLLHTTLPKVLLENSLPNSKNALFGKTEKEPVQQNDYDDKLR